MKKIGTYWKVYMVMVLVLVVLGVALSIYTKKSLTTYEECQPENLVKEEMAKVKNAAKYRTLSVIMDVSKYDEDTLDQYYDIMNKAENWTCKVISGGYSDTAQTWGIYADDKLVAQVNLTGSNTRTMLLILTASDWEVAGLSSGLDLVPTSTPGPTNTPIIKYTYELTLPEGYKIVAENQEVEGSKNSDDTVSYNFVTTDASIKISDAYGSTIDYAYGDTFSGHNIVVKLPDVFSISVNGLDLSKYMLAEKEDIDALEVCYGYDDSLPHLAVYHFDNALAHPDFAITDQNGETVTYEYEGDNINITNLVKVETVADEITGVTDIVSIAEKWSYLMTRDLDLVELGYRDGQYGYDVITKYIAKDSPLLNIAKGYVNGDIWTISNHVLKNPPFTEETVSGYIRYSDDIFSVDVHLIEWFTIRNGSETRSNEMNNTIFFIRNTGDGEPWLMVDMMSNEE